MAELELSIMSRGTTTTADLKPLLDEFEAQNRIHVRLRVLAWDTAWAELLKVALYQHGPDVSEIGSTWLGSYVGMDALRPLADHEVATIGGASVFVPSAWQSGSLADPLLGKPVQWAIPWWADTRLLYYRRDILGQAGIEEQTAFQDTAQLAHTVASLQAAGVSVPWVVPTHQARMTIHNVAGWVWGAGGRFVSDDGKQIRFHEPEARSGIRAYFEMARYLALSARDLDDTQSEALFAQGQAAVTISGPWLLQLTSPQVAADVGITLPPGVPFVGGSHLVCWKHAVHDEAVIKLIRFLTSWRVQATLGQRSGLLPSRLDVLSNPPFADHPLYRIATQGLERGRSFPSFTLWGLVEDKLNEVLSQLWADLLANPGLDLGQTIAERLASAAQRLDLTLGSS
jgi:multiple sugar transport system substrate-binding protein